MSEEKELIGFLGKPKELKKYVEDKEKVLTEQEYQEILKLQDSHSSHLFTLTQWMESRLKFDAVIISLFSLIIAALFAVWNADASQGVGLAESLWFAIKSFLFIFIKTFVIEFIILFGLNFLYGVFTRKTISSYYIKRLIPQLNNETIAILFVYRRIYWSAETPILRASINHLLEEQDDLNDFLKQSKIEEPLLMLKENEAVEGDYQLKGLGD